MQESLETTQQFEGRKQDHIRLSLDEKNEALGFSGFDSFTLNHNALPELNFNDISLRTHTLGFELPTPFLVSSMTAGHNSSFSLNLRLAKACQERGWLMGVGSQRRQLNDPLAENEWKNIRKEAPDVKLLANLGLTQIIQTPIEVVSDVVKSLDGIALIIHLNALQEVMQPEGTPHFKGGLQAIEKLVKTLEIPIVIKETGCGFSKSTLRQLQETGVQAVDVSGLGGTHWGRIEGNRHQNENVYQSLSKAFSHWGVSTVQSLLNAKEIGGPFETWASGGVRNGLQAAQCVALGANIVGFAKPILQAALLGVDELKRFMELTELELRTALFCTGSATLKDLQQNEEVIQWQNR
ncbi:MAG: type 2 isopentenyl-diphosphate Delta-isomerase [Bdellovibrionales bacterium]|nr:type 2 isopentenyl-diphosphate Delta-isomerase [Bdellovibrionales bacterium]